MNRIKIAVFASGRGSNLNQIINSIKKNELNCEICFVLSNNSNSLALSIAKENNIETIHLSEKLFDYNKYVETMINLIKEYKLDFIILAGYMKKIPEEIIKFMPDRIINIHPALLPQYGGKGMYGMNVHNAVYNAKDKYSGITVHYVNENYDEGSIIFQEKIDISNLISPEEISSKVLELEHKLFPIVLNNIFNQYKFKENKSIYD